MTPTNHLQPETATQPADVPGWLHVWALVTVGFTVALIGIGALVTTLRVGMADPIWPTTPWYLFFIDWQEPEAGFLIEHTHRLFGYTVGICSIVLALGLAFGVRRGPIRWLGFVALAAVSIQGILGGYRVRLHALLGPNLALIHGVFAQIVFSILVCTAVLTSQRVRSAKLDREDVQPLLLPGLLLVVLLFAQLVLGATMRQDMLGRTAPKLHMLNAFAVLAVFGWYLLRRSRDPELSARTKLGVSFLGVCFVAQIVLGVEALMSKYAFGFYPELQQPTTLTHALIRSAHVVVGACILATTVALEVGLWVASARIESALETQDTPRETDQEAHAPTPTLEGIG